MDRARLKVLTRVFLVLLIAAAAAGCGGKKAGEQAPPDPKLVVLETAKIDKASRFSEISGLLQPIEESVASFETSGRILDMTRKEGDRVGSGDIMARLDATEYSVQVAQAGTGLDKAQTGYQKAKDDFDRMKELYGQGALSKSDFENSQVRYSVAEQDYLLAQKSYSLLTGSGLGKDQLRAPIGGIVIAKLLSVGQLVSPGTPVYRIGKVDNLKVILPVPDSEIATWKAGDSVALSLYQDTREGKVTRIFPAANQGTGTIGVEVTAANPQHDWFPGQVIRARYTVAAREGLFIPVEAVLNQGLEKPYIFVAAGDKAVRTAVTTGDLIGNRLEILSGLKPGDRVIVKGADKLFEGDIIKEAGVAVQ
ncbi:MAG: efflux RND transporter periplasmic adaptor subunit [Desulfocucumaceae bacterium]